MMSNKKKNPLWDTCVAESFSIHQTKFKEFTLNRSLINLKNNIMLKNHQALILCNLCTCNWQLPLFKRFWIMFLIFHYIQLEFNRLW